MKVRVAVASVVSLACALALAAPASFAGEEEDAAVKAAKRWLGLVDGGKYAASWDGASSYFQANVGKDVWAKQLTGLREPLGDVKSRRVAKTELHTRLPGTPDGRYVVISFETQFANKAEAVETVTPMLDDGKWRVSGYYIK